MRTDNALLDDIPNEVIREMLEHLSLRQQVAVSRVSPVWRFLVTRSFKDTLKARFPFLMEDELEGMSVASLLKKLNNLQKIYARLAKSRGLLPEALQIENLRAFSISDHKNTSLTERQITFLKNFSIASGVDNENDKSAYKDKVLILEACARIGNLKKMAQLIEENNQMDKKLPWGAALFDAAENGHVTCVAYLIATCKKMISPGSKIGALHAAARRGQLRCVQYLIEGCGEDIPIEEKVWALELAAGHGRLRTLKYLMTVCGQAISIYNKTGAVMSAAVKGHLECVKCLIEAYGQDKAQVALVSGASGGHIACVAYLMKTYGAVISPAYKEEALISAAERGQLECVKYLIEIEKQEISFEHKDKAREKAVNNGYLDCAAYLEGVLNPSAPLLLFAHSSSNNALPSLASPTLKRDRENNNSDDEMQNKKKRKIMKETEVEEEGTPHKTLTSSFQFK